MGSNSFTSTMYGRVTHGRVGGSPSTEAEICRGPLSHVQAVASGSLLAAPLRLATMDTITVLAALS